MSMVKMCLDIPRELRIEIRRHAADNDLPMGREVIRVLSDAYGLQVEKKGGSDEQSTL